jgi:hypothetical protein
MLLILIRSLSKPFSNREMLGAHEAQNRSVHDVHEDLSIGATQQVSLENEFRKRSIKL